MLKEYLLFTLTKTIRDVKNKITPSHRFGQLIITNNIWFDFITFRPSSVFCQTWEPTRNFKLHHLLNPQGSPILIPLTITGYKC